MYLCSCATAEYYGSRGSGIWRGIKSSTTVPLLPPLCRQYHHRGHRDHSDDDICGDDGEQLFGDLRC